MTPPNDESSAAPQPGDDRATPQSGSGPDLDPRATRVAQAVKTWQRHLVDLGGRNTLLWYRDLPSGTLDLTTAHPGGLAMLLAGRPTRLSDLVRESVALDEARRRARTIHAKTLELSEERGIAAGFLALGMATWTVRGASRAPAAPVLLRRCVLRPTGAAREDFDLDLGHEVEVNPVLEHYLRSEQGLRLDTGALEDLASHGGSFDPYPVYAELTRLCADVPDFSVTPRLVVGTFSYAKLPMVADLAAQGSSLAGHDVVAALAGDPDALRAVHTEVPSPALDADGGFDVDPARELLVVDADFDQQAAIDAVRSGAHVVIQGPPGTGKSQTITNLVAGLAGEGRRVLFVAEKRAAVDAVLSRLERVGLADLVLDGRDGGVDRRGLAQQLGAALERATQAQDRAEDPDTEDLERTLVASRGTLVGHSRALHEFRQPWGVSAYEAQEAISTLSAAHHPPTSRVRLRGAQLERLDRQTVEDLGRALTEAAALGAWSTDEGTDPWYGARITTAEEALRARDITSRYAEGGLQALEQTMHEVFAEVTLPQAKRLSDWSAVLDTVGNVRDTLEVFRPEVFDIPLGDLVAATGDKDYRDANGVALSWSARARLRRQTRSLLRPGPPPADLHAALLDAQKQRVAWQQMAGAGGRPEIPVDLDRARAAYEAVASDLRWLGERVAPTAAGGDLMDASLEDLERRLTELAARPERLTILPQVTGALDALREAGMGALVDDLARRGVEPEDVSRELDFVWWASLVEEFAKQDPRYGAHDGAELHRVVREYVAADHEHLRRNADRVRAGASRRLREVLADHPDQAALVRAEAAKVRRHRPLREMLPLAGQTLTAAKPVWAMSPLVVASMVPPGRWFDVVILDEASQIPVARALSAISRATQVVVVGDDRQLPPSTFSTSALDEEIAPEDEVLTEGYESVLDGLAAVLPTQRLRVHYRSHDQRLVELANEAIYGGALATFPGTRLERPVTLETVEGSGVVQPGEEAIETTEAEVSRVVDLVLEHARTRPQESLGVITLGHKHANRLDDALRRALVDADDVGDFFQEDRPERFFVKPLGQVQGDERDAVIVSVGYGKTPHGRVLHRFGALNLEGGERRLNVAVTRARRRMTVVSCLLAEDLDPARLKAHGALLLRDLLAYAADGTLPAPEPVPAAAPEPAPEPAPGLAPGPSHALRRELAERLRGSGLVVHEAFGAGDHLVDLAVEDPETPGSVLVAVETDGPAYASMPCTRDRDRLRPEQLERLGWGYVRVWSTDLFRDPARSVSRVHAAVARAAAARTGGSTPDPTEEPSAADGSAVATSPEEELMPREIEGEFVPSRDEGARTRRVRGRRAGRVADHTAPEQTSDDTDLGWGERPDQDAHDRWLQEQRPPHWGSD